MKTQKCYLPVSVKDGMPAKANENYLTISERGVQTSRFFNGQRFETAPYEGEITHWLEEKDLIVLTEEQAKEMYSKDEVKSMIQNIYSEFAESLFKPSHVTLRKIIEIEIEGHPLKPIKIFTDK